MTQSMAEGETATDAVPNDTSKADPSGDTDGMLEIAKQLVKMADGLTVIKQCMADVKAGIYIPS